MIRNTILGERAINPLHCSQTLMWNCFFLFPDHYLEQSILSYVVFPDLSNVNLVNNFDTSGLPGSFPKQINADQYRC